MSTTCGCKAVLHGLKSALHKTKQDRNELREQLEGVKADRDRWRRRCGRLTDQLLAR